MKRFLLDNDLDCLNRKGIKRYVMASKHSENNLKLGDTILELDSALRDELLSSEHLTLSAPESELLMNKIQKSTGQPLIADIIL